MGQFTQLNPIGMSGGLNLYGYANGDPVNFRDPSGLSAEEGACVENGIALSVFECDAPEAQALLDELGFAVDVGCIPLVEGIDAFHCGIRITYGSEVWYWELNRDGGTKLVRPIPNPTRYDGTWVPVTDIGGQSVRAFTESIINNIAWLGMMQHGTRYWPTGNTNSNRFVYDAITAAGGRVPWRAVPGAPVYATEGRITFATGGYRRGYAPGLCGGVLTTGTNCSR